MLRNGTLIDDRYEILGTIGVGGFGAVYAAMQTQLNRKVAVKILNTTVLHEKDGAARFEREAKAINALKHKNVVAFYGYGAWQQAPYMVMEFVDGTSLDRILAKETKIEPVRALRLIKQVFEGLAAAHTAGVVHRDLKPSNILITRDASGAEMVKIIDFGLAKLMPGYGIPGQKLTETGYALGTCHYMPPEQALGTPVDERADIYSAGCILYQMLSGKLPFDAESNVAIMFKHINDTAQPLEKLISSDASPNFVEALASLVNNCIAKDAQHRYQSAQNVVEDVDNILAGRLGAVTPHTVLGPKPAGGHKKIRLTMQAIAAISLVCCTALLVIIIIMMTQTETAPEQIELNTLGSAEDFIMLTAREHRGHTPITEAQELKLLQIYNDRHLELTKRDRQVMVELLLRGAYKNEWTEAEALQRAPLAHEFERLSTMNDSPLQEAKGIIALEKFRFGQELDDDKRRDICMYISVTTPRVLNEDYRFWCTECLKNYQWADTRGDDGANALLAFASAVGADPVAEKPLRHLSADDWVGGIDTAIKSGLARYLYARKQYAESEGIAKRMLRDLDPDSRTIYIGKDFLSWRPLERGDSEAIKLIWNEPPVNDSFDYRWERGIWLARAAIMENKNAEALKLLPVSSTTVKLRTVALCGLGRFDDARALLKRERNSTVNPINDPQLPQYSWDHRQFEKFARKLEE